MTGYINPALAWKRLRRCFRLEWLRLDALANYARTAGGVKKRALHSAGGNPGKGIYCSASPDLEQGLTAYRAPLLTEEGEESQRYRGKIESCAGAQLTLILLSGHCLILVADYGLFGGITVNTKRG